MMMKTLAIILFSVSCLQAAPSRITDGKIEIATVTVQGIIVFNREEFQKQVDAYDVSGGSFPLVIQAIAQDPDEVNISTNCLSFDSYSDFQEAKTKAGLLKKIRELRLEINELEDFPGLQLVLRRRLAWLVSYYKSL